MKVNMMHAIMTIVLILETKVPLAAFFVLACYTANADVPNLVPRYLSYQSLSFSLRRTGRREP